MLKPYERVDAKKAADGIQLLIFDRGLAGSPLTCIRNGRLEVVFPTAGDNVAGESCDLVIQTYTS